MYDVHLYYCRLKMETLSIATYNVHRWYSEDWKENYNCPPMDFGH